METDREKIDRLESELQALRKFVYGRLGAFEQATAAQTIAYLPANAMPGHHDLTPPTAPKAK